MSSGGGSLGFDFWPVLAYAMAAVAAWGVLELWRDLRRSRPKLEPESRFVVRLSDSEVVCERPDGKLERVGWADLRKVEIVTTDEGPLVPDVFWVLEGTQGGCAVPQGATGEKELLARLQPLPGFDNNAVIAAMVSTSNRRFPCWMR